MTVVIAFKTVLASFEQLPVLTFTREIVKRPCNTETCFDKPISRFRPAPLSHEASPLGNKFPRQKSRKHMQALLRSKSCTLKHCPRQHCRQLAGILCDMRDMHFQLPLISTSNAQWTAGQRRRVSN